MVKLRRDGFSTTSRICAAFNFAGVHYVQSKEESIALNRRQDSAITHEPMAK